MQNLGGGEAQISCIIENVEVVYEWEKKLFPFPDLYTISMDLAFSFLFSSAYFAGQECFYLNFPSAKAYIYFYWGV